MRLATVQAGMARHPRLGQKWKAARLFLPDASAIKYDGHMKSMSKILSTCIVASFLVSGCVGLNSGVKTTVDPYKGTETKHVAIMVAGDLTATILRVQLADGKTGYSLGVTFLGTDWMFIDSGESCVVLADGERLPFAGEGSWKFREVLGGNLIRETAWYVLIPRERLVKIANAQQASLKVYGTKLTREGRFNEAGRKAISKFLAATESEAK